MYKYILQILKEKGITVDEASKGLNISKVNFYKKISGVVKFSLNEAQILSELVNIPLDELFPTQQVSISETK